jgi:DNA polymerase III delta prime subunit
VYFILVTCAPRSLPSTILSRCQTWHFERLSQEQLRQAGALIGLELPDHVVQAADGSIGRAQQILGTTEFPVEFEPTLLEIAGGGPIYLSVELSRELGQQKQRTEEILGRLATFARVQMQASLSNADLCEQWARFLSAILSAEHLLLMRNFTPQATYFALLRTLMPLPMPRFTGEVGSDTYFSRLL